MTFQQFSLLAILFFTMALFLWGRWRHDLVAVAALLACIFTGMVPVAGAFSGFSHPAVITVACVLVLGAGLQYSGAMGTLAQRCLPATTRPVPAMLALITLAAALSAFMNNVGALALLMPIAISMAAKLELPPGKVLMPLAFGSILGGMTTLIGTPPNMVVSGYRDTAGRGAFVMFDFTPVGLAVAIGGILFIALIGWRLVPARRQAEGAAFDTGSYLSEVRIDPGSKADGMLLRDAESLLVEADAQVVSLVRNDLRISAPNSRRLLRAGDILVIEVEPESLPTALSSLGLKLEEDVKPVTEEEATGGKSATKEETDEEPAKEEKAKVEEVVIQEMVVLPDAALLNRSATNIALRTRYGINLLAISRQGLRSIRRLRSTRIRAGDVLLLQGAPEALSGFAADYGLLPLAERDIYVPKKGLAWLAALVMLAAVSLAAFGVLPVAVTFLAASLVYVLTGIVPVRSLYTSIDWPVVVLLAAMLPIAEAMATTGTADYIASVLLQDVAQGHAIAGLVALLVLTMFLSDLMNNAATAAVMCPIAISTAAHLGVSADAFLMAVAVGASCAFLTPIGHQNNTLILGPGGFRFGDYWRMGLALEAIVIMISVPMLLWVWPL